MLQELCNLKLNNVEDLFFDRDQIVKCFFLELSMNGLFMKYRQMFFFLFLFVNFFLINLVCVLDSKM